MDDKITEAAKTAGFDWADLGVRDRLAFERFYAIATQRQQERIAELEAQVQALSLDAGRYRYLTQKMGDLCVTIADENPGPVLKAAAADQAIDAAIAAGKGEG